MWQSYTIYHYYCCNINSLRVVLDGNWNNSRGRPGGSTNGLGPCDRWGACSTLGELRVYSRDTYQVGSDYFVGGKQTVRFRSDILRETNPGALLAMKKKATHPVLISLWCDPGWCAQLVPKSQNRWGDNPHTWTLFCVCAYRQVSVSKTERWSPPAGLVNRKSSCAGG